MAMLGRRLEYQSVCVLVPGMGLARLEAGTEPMVTRIAALGEREHQATIDALRVALSRATETLRVRRPRGGRRGGGFF